MKLPRYIKVVKAKNQSNPKALMLDLSIKWWAWPFITLKYFQPSKWYYWPWFISATIIVWVRMVKR